MEREVMGADSVNRQNGRTKGRGLELCIRSNREMSVLMFGNQPFHDQPMVS